MAITYDWTIPNCEHDIATGGINVIHWSVGKDAFVNMLKASLNSDEE